MSDMEHEFELWFAEHFDNADETSRLILRLAFLDGGRAQDRLLRSESIARLAGDWNYSAREDT